MMAAFPPVVSQSALGKLMANFQQSYLPLAQYGLDWLLPALLGMVLGVACHLVKQHAATKVQVPQEDQN